MSLLKAEPPAPVSSLPELLALAHILEQAAAARYAQLAEEMESLQLPRVAAVFRQLVSEELEHAHNVERWAHAATGALPDHQLICWQPPETFDEEEARQIASSPLASAYRALSMAVRNEERAFAFWTYVAAQAESPEVREAAERMAGEELRHAAIFRRERRRAFHDERARSDPPLKRAARAEQSLAALFRNAAESDGPTSPEWRRLSEEAEAMGVEVAALSADPILATFGPEPFSAADWSAREAWRCAEAACDAYLDAADAARDEKTMAQLQRLAERAIARAAELRLAATAQVS